MDSYLKSPGQSLQIYILKILLSVFISTLSIKVRVFKKKKKENGGSHCRSEAEGAREDGAGPGPLGGHPQAPTHRMPVPQADGARPANEPPSVWTPLL